MAIGLVALNGMQLDHVGIASEDARGLATLYGDVLELPIAHEETFENLQLVFLGVDQPGLELLEPIDSEGPVARFLERHGPGVHHLAFEVPDLEDALRMAESQGIDPIDETPQPGARGHLVAFLHPRSTGGVLVEFVER